MSDVTKDLLEALLIVARMAEDLKKPCGMDPESPQAIRNAQYMNISYAARAAITRAEAAPQPGRPTMAVWFGEVPESNGKMNWTAILYRRDGSLMDGVTIYRSEYKDRVRYEADRLRWLIGELERKPNILAYDAELIVEAALAEPQPDADGWIPWAGGKCPVDSGEVKVKLRNGCECADIASKFRWSHTDGPGDIIAYRVVEAQP